MLEEAVSATKKSALPAGDTFTIFSFPNFSGGVVIPFSSNEPTGKFSPISRKIFVSKAKGEE